MKKIFYGNAVLLCSVYMCASAFMLNDTQRILWAQPVSMTRHGVTSYFSRVFNDKGYGNFCVEHLVDFLIYTPSVADPMEYLLRITNLFHIRLKEASWTNPYAVLTFLNMLQSQIATVLHESHQQRVSAVKKTVYRALLARFRELKNDPETFLSALACEVIEVADATHTIVLQQKLGRLIESALDKLVFSPAEQEQAWEMVKSISHALEALHYSGIIADESLLQSCYWSLLFRFIVCLDCAGDSFSVEAYQLMKRDIADANCPLLCHSTAEKGMVKQRVEWLKEAILAGEVRTRVARA